MFRKADLEAVRSKNRHWKGMLRQNERGIFVNFLSLSKKTLAVFAPIW